MEINELDKDLYSVQETRNLIKKADAAQREYEKWNQEQREKLLQKIVEVCMSNAESLAKLAAEETTFGNWQDKVLKNIFASKDVYENMKDLKTTGIIKKDEEQGVWDVAVPLGVIAGLIPSTNPTSTVMFKSLIALKAGNAIIFSPHPNAQNCIKKTVEIISEAAAEAGAPDNLVQCISSPTIQATKELMTNRGTALILATGGEGMVRAAYRSGIPAIGVGPGNGPAFIEKSADIPHAVKQIVDSKTFDNGTICASEQSIVVESCIEDTVKRELNKQGAYFLDESQSRKVAKLLLKDNGAMNPAIVGKTAQVIAEMSGITIGSEIRVLISVQTSVAKKNPYSREKLCPVLGFYSEQDWESASRRCIEILENEGAGHTMVIHSSDTAIIEEFVARMPVSRLLVNAPGALGGIGAVTNLVPSLTLGCGAIGGSSTSDNVGPMNLINIRKVAFGKKELEELRVGNVIMESNKYNENQLGGLSVQDIEQITRLVIEKLRN